MEDSRINVLNEAIKMAREASNEKERFWLDYPYGNAYTIVYGYVAIVHMGMRFRGRGEIGRVESLLDMLTFRQEVVFTYLPRLFQRIHPDDKFNELIMVALSGKIKKGGIERDINMSDDEILARVIDMSLDAWDNRFVKNLDTLKEVIGNDEFRAKYSLGEAIHTEPARIEISELKKPDILIRSSKEGLLHKIPEGSPIASGISPLGKLSVDRFEDDEDPDYEDLEESSLLLATFKNTAAKVGSIRVELSKRIFGQENCISKFAEGLFHALMTETGRKKGGPRGVFFFVGPPGVGKTYLAESLAELLNLPYKRFNMSEYAADTDYFQLTGTDPSYRNPHEGLLSRYIKRHSDSVVVFDEIEKAGPKVHNIFLQILGLGEFDDDYTKETVNCRDTIMIFTSNAGADIYENRKGDLSEIPESVIMNSIAGERHPVEKRAIINPALCSRLGSGCVILFNYVDEEALLQIVKGGFERVCEEYSNKMGLKISFDDRLPLLFLFHFSNSLDARRASIKSYSFLEKEIYQLARQLGNRKDLLDKAGEISFELSLPVDEEIRRFFDNEKKEKYIALCGEEMKALFPNKADSYEIEFTETEIEKVDEISDVSAIFVDPYFGCDVNVWHPIGLDDYDCTGMNCLKTIVESKVGIPVYLLDTKGHISPTDKETLLQLGARGFISLGEAGSDKYLEKLAQTLYISRQYRKLCQRGYILDYDTAVEVADEGKRIVVSFYDMWKTQAMDESTGQVALRDDERPQVKLSDVVGLTHAKEELRYYIEYLKEPLKFLQSGGELPKGLLLYGPPGTGKTLLARALAGETDCSFFQVPASELLSPYVGESKDKVKELFKRARKYAPSVIFIDEIDAIGRSREGGNTDSGINALLTEMDGFKKHNDKPVFVLAATNYGAMDDENLRLDQALLRRFDNRIYVGLPRKSDRLIYMEKIVSDKKLSVSDECLKTITSRTIGQSLDMLNHVFDMAHRISVREKKELSDALLLEALEEYLYGEKKEHTPDYYVKTAIHEAGHAYVAWKSGLKPGFMTIVSRGGYGGFTALDDVEDKTEYTKNEIIGLIRVSLAGREAEKEFYGGDLAINTGAESDLRKATGKALDYICRYGMSEDELVNVDIRAIMGAADYGRYLDKANEILLREQAETAKLVKNGKKMIKKLSDVLCDSSHLTEKEILKVLEGK